MRCRCGVILNPGQMRCRDCSAVILAMIKTDRITPPVTVPADKTRRVPWDLLSFQERQLRRQYRIQIAIAVAVIAVVVAIVTWAMAS